MKIDRNISNISMKTITDWKFVDILTTKSILKHKFNGITILLQSIKNNNKASHRILIFESGEITGILFQNFVMKYKIFSNEFCPSNKI